MLTSPRRATKLHAAKPPQVKARRDTLRVANLMKNAWERDIDQFKQVD
jgi:hypothetical protein